MHNQNTMKHFSFVYLVDKKCLPLNEGNQNELEQV